MIFHEVSYFSSILNYYFEYFLRLLVETHLSLFLTNADAIPALVCTVGQCKRLRSLALKPVAILEDTINALLAAPPFVLDTRDGWTAERCMSSLNFCPEEPSVVQGRCG